MRETAVAAALAGDLNSVDATGIILTIPIASGRTTIVSFFFYAYVFVLL